MVENLGQSVRFFLRGMRRSPAFAVATVGMLALGIGATTIIVAAVEAVVLRPLPIPDLDRIVTIESDFAALALHHARVAPAEIADLGLTPGAFDAVGAYRDESVDLMGTGEPQQLVAASTVGDFFAVFGVRPLLGRLYDSTYVRAGNTHVVVLSHGAWQRLLGGDRNVIGRTLILNDQAYELIGVLKPGVDYPKGTDLWTPQALDRGAAADERGALTVNAVARLRRGVALQQASSLLAATNQHLIQAYPQLYSGGPARTFVVTPLSVALAGSLRPVLILLMVAVGFVLLIVCANVGSLQLVRTIHRSREFAIRSAVGASRLDVMGLLVGESAALALLGGAIGLLIAEEGLRFIGRSSSPELAMLREAHFDVPVLFVSLAVTLLTALLFGLAPLVRAWSGTPADALRANAARGASAGRAQGTFLRSVTVVQFALALVLILGTSVALRSVRRLLNTSPGFEVNGLVASRVRLTGSRYATSAGKADFHDRLLEALRANHAVRGEATVIGAPFVSVKEMEHGVTLPRPGQSQGTPGVNANYWLIGGDYFRTMEIPVRRGRTLDAGDNVAGSRTVVIDELLARELFGDANPLGKAVGYFGTVVGVVGSVKKSDLAAPLRGSLYTPSDRAQGALDDFTVLARGNDPTATAAALRTAIRITDPQLPIPPVTTMTDAVDRSLGVRRLAGEVLEAFGGLAVLLAVLGIYGVTSYATAQRMKEFGIRLALGASPTDISRMVATGALVFVTMGIAIGEVAYLGLSRLLSSLAYGVSERDPVAAAIAAAGLALVAILASWLPARRAARVNAIQALRSE